jgi:hypothetical protein
MHSAKQTFHESASRAKRKLFVCFLCVATICVLVVCASWFRQQSSPIKEYQPVLAEDKLFAAPSADGDFYPLASARGRVADKVPRGSPESRDSSLPNATKFSTTTATTRLFRAGDKARVNRQQDPRTGEFALFSSLGVVQSHNSLIFNLLCMIFVVHFKSIV